ncbi:MAG: acetyl-CoA carboxylase biotin carboxyl carrier protein [Cyanobacteriota bacterium]|jgi:acetyl-CoA carboxylase biotin carboxyl carrier protein|nr:acetyl-CoA carboxylase biotin carboxyl carrier protein [Cyanobacteriota bacterium]
MAMQLDHQQLRDLLEQLSKSDIQEFRLEGEDFRLEVRRNLPVSVTAPAPQALPVMMAPAAQEAAAPSPAPPPPATVASRSDLLPITAPMVGTFYRSPAPGEPPFVELGTRIKAGQTVCILEAMKLMNELEAEVAGEVVEILVESGTPVEFGQVLMRIRP